MVSLIFSGDFAPLVPLSETNKDHFSAINDLLSGADLHITNLECPLTSSDQKTEKTGPHIKADHEAAALLPQAGVDIVCLANNHIFDYGERGIIDTINICENINIETLGIVSRHDGKAHWIIREIKGIKLGLLNYCEHEFSVRSKGLLGACGYDPVDAYYDISHLRQQVNYLIVLYHGGNEYYDLPRPGLKKDFHYLADIGADAVFGHHTHVFSGYEIYNGKPLVYSLGNFFFPYEGEPESWDEGVLLNCIIDESIKFELIPLYQCKDGFKVTLMEGDKKASVLQKIKDLSSIIADDSKLEEAWRLYVQNFGVGLSEKILYPTKVDKFLLKLPFFKKYVSDKNRCRSLINILRCTSLEQLLIDSLKIKG